MNVGSTLSDAQVVTASGLIVTASPTSYSDLFWALRGGGNNFGLVVKFNLKAYSLPGGSLWGGTKVFTEDQFPKVYKAFANLVANSPQDTNAGQWLAMVLQPGGLKIAAAELYYAKPVANAPIFNEYNAIPAVADSTAFRTLPEYAKANQDSNPNGLREIYYTITVKADAALVQEAANIFYNLAPSVADAAGILPTIVFQGITQSQLTNMARNGGNALGLNTNTGPLYIIHLAIMWNLMTPESTEWPRMC